MRLSILGTDYDHIPDMIQEDNPEEGNSLKNKTEFGIFFINTTFKIT